MPIWYLRQIRERLELLINTIYLDDMQQIKGSEALVRSLIEEGVQTIFGYPGGAIMPVFDALYQAQDRVDTILVRHEQGATHAAQGFSRVSGQTGVVIVTSGPAATNVITGIADAMIDSTPMVVITGQIATSLLGSDAFQEADVVGITQPISKWSYQIRRAEDIAWAVARAFFLAKSGRPGPVVLDFAKNAQVGLTDFNYNSIRFIRSYTPIPDTDPTSITAAAALINSSERPLVLLGQGVILSGAEAQFQSFVEKGSLPVGATLLGLSALPSMHPLYKGMLGMHGHLAPVMKTSEADLLIAVGMRFDDRVTGDLKRFAPHAKVIHLDIDPSEIDKNVKTAVAVLGDAKDTLTQIEAHLVAKDRTEWLDSFTAYEHKEREEVINQELYPTQGAITMGEVVNEVAVQSHGDAVIVTDVGQNQMMAARYSKFNRSRSFITSGGLGTMGFGLPAAIGAKIGAPDRQVCLFCGDGGLQMTIQELGTILETGVVVKIILLNNSFLGMVRQWQELFFEKRYSKTPMINPDYGMIAAGYGLLYNKVSDRTDLAAAVTQMLASDHSYLLEVCVEQEGMVYPMVPAGGAVSEIIMNQSVKEI